MMTPNQKKWGVLTVLLTVLAVTIVIGYRLNKGPDPVVVQAQGQKPVSRIARSRRSENSSRSARSSRKWKGIWERATFFNIGQPRLRSP